MSDIMESLGKVSARLSEEAFLSNKGLSNEVGIHVFCYEPEHEMTVRAYFANLKGKSDVPYRLIERGAVALRKKCSSPFSYSLMRRCAPK